MADLRAGVVGVGYLGQFHAEKYTKLPGVRLAGVVDADPARASQIAEKLGCRVWKTPADMTGEVDVVSIAAPTVLHHRIARPLLESGVHVLLEKPITVTLQEADELISIAERRGLVLQIGHIERFNPAITAIKPLIQRPRYIQAERSAPFTARCTDVNVVLDLMIHDLDIVADLAGSRPRELSASGASVITRELDAVQVRILFENGCAADVAASRVSDEKKRLMRVFDQAGLFTADYQAQRASRSLRGTGTVPELVAAELSAERRDTLLDEIAAFVASVRTGAKPMAGGREGRNALALAALITSTIEKGTTAFVPVP